MRARLACKVFLLFLLFSLSCNDRGTEKFNIRNLVSEGLLKDHMDRVGAFMGWLERAIEDGQWEKISLYARHVDSLCDVLNLQTSQEVPLEFTLIDGKFHESIDSIIDASNKMDDGEVRERLKTLKKVCEECHKMFR